MAPIRRLTTDGFLKKDLCWSPDGKRLLFSSSATGEIIVTLREEDGSFDLLTEGPSDLRPRPGCCIGNGTCDAPS